MTLHEVMSLVRGLSLLDKVRLIEQLAPEIERELIAQQSIQQSKSRRSLWGLWADLGEAPSSEDIRQIRQEMWSTFPRTDF